MKISKIYQINNIVVTLMLTSELKNLTVILYLLNQLDTNKIK
jgi:hypothetical protein